MARISANENFSVPLGVPLKYFDLKKSGRPAKHFCNTWVFDNPLSIDATYWLGFIYADGSVSWVDCEGRSRFELQINVQLRDLGHLWKLRCLLGGDVRITTSCARFGIGSKQLCHRLSQLGIMPQKSQYPLEPPQLHGDAKIAFLRGLFDGDGCLHITKRGYLQAAFCGHPAIVKWFACEVGIAGSERFRDNTLYYQWTSGCAAKQLVRYLYGTSGPALKRKAEIAKRFM